MSNVKDEAEFLEIVGTLTMTDETSKKYEELAKKIDKILKKKKYVRESKPEIYVRESKPEIYVRESKTTEA